MANGNQAGNSVERWVGWLAWPSFLLIAAGVAWHVSALSTGFSGSDEPSHFVNSYFIWKYLTTSGFPHPMAFAEQFYVSYPKLSLGHWPPMYYAFIGGLFLLLPIETHTVFVVNMMVAVGAAGLLFTLLRKDLGTVWAVFAAWFFLLMPTMQEAQTFFMLDLPLAVITMLAAGVWLRFVRAPGYGWGVTYGMLAAVAILTKGNGWFLGLFPVIHMVIYRNWALLKVPGLYLGGGVALLMVFPWYWVTAQISADGFNYEAGLSYATLALGKNLATLFYNLGWLGAFFAILGLISSGGVASRLGLEGVDHKGREWVGLSLAMILAILALHSLIPVDITHRYMLTTLPFLSVLALVGLRWSVDRLAGRLSETAANSLTVLLMIVIMVPGLVYLQRSTPQGDLRMDAVAADVIAHQPGQYKVVMVDASPTGEGAFIAEALVASEGRNMMVVRSSKVFAKSDFMGNDYRLLVHTPEQVLARLQALGINYLVLDRREGGNLFEHSVLVEKALALPDSGYELAGDYPHKHREGRSFLYIAKSPSSTDMEAVRELNLPGKKPQF